MERKIKYTKVVIGMVILAFFITGCNPVAVREGETAKEYYERGMTYLNEGRHRRAIKVFDGLVEEFPYSMYTKLSQLRKAEALYQKGSKNDFYEAIIVLEDFQVMHPKDREMDKVVYLLGMCNYNLMSKLDRDQTNTKNAIIYFERLKRNYRDSDYIKDADKYLAASRQRLAEHNYYVGKFYFRTKKYDAAIIRFLNIDSEHSDSTLMPQTLYYLGRCYMKKYDPKAARSVFNRLKSTYPDNKYSKKADKYIRDIEESASIMPGDLPEMQIHPQNPKQKVAFVFMLARSPLSR